jgi:hypothetical protein
LNRLPQLNICCLNALIFSTGKLYDSTFMA